MSTLLKDRYSPAFYDTFSGFVAEVVPDFDKGEFINLIFDENWNTKELKDRMKHTSKVLHQFLPKDFEQATQTIEVIIKKLIENGFTGYSLECMFLPDYIETYGIEHFNHSVKAIEFITQFTSCEFAVRPFVIKYGTTMLDQMLEWSQHQNHHVRRLASEGSRPRLPWAMALPAIKKNPEQIIPILENLKNDASEYVRRSVANSLNDIAKDNAHIVVAIARNWKGLSRETDAIIKHGCRTLLKQGHVEILDLYQLSASSKLVVSDFNISTKIVQIGTNLSFSFSIQNIDNQQHTIRLEYGLYYLRQNGLYGKKVFKISERQISAGEKIKIEKNQSFKLITTRRFYAGVQKLSIIVNGQERASGEFELLMD